MDDQQNRRAESGLHAGKEPRNDSQGRDAGRVQGRRKRHLTAQIKPATKHALMAQLAAAADALMILREQLQEAELYAGLLQIAASRPWWRRLLGLR